MIAITFRAQQEESSIQQHTIELSSAAAVGVAGGMGGAACATSDASSNDDIAVTTSGGGSCSSAAENDAARKGALSRLLAERELGDADTGNGWTATMTAANAGHAGCFDPLVHVSARKLARRETGVSPLPPRPDSLCSTSSPNRYSSGVESTCGDDANDPPHKAPSFQKKKERVGGRSDDFMPHEDAELFFFGYDERGCPVGTHRHGGMPTAYLKWANRGDTLTKFTTHGVSVPNTNAGRRKLQNRLINLKKKHAAEGADFIDRLRAVRANPCAPVNDIDSGFDGFDFAAVGAPPNEDADGHSSSHSSFSTGLFSTSSSLSGTKVESAPRPIPARGTVNTRELAVAPDLSVALSIVSDDGDDIESDITSLLSKSSLSSFSDPGTSRTTEATAVQRMATPPYIWMKPYKNLSSSPGVLVAGVLRLFAAFFFLVIFVVSGYTYFNVWWSDAFLFGVMQQGLCTLAFFPLVYDEISHVGLPRPGTLAYNAMVLSMGGLAGILACISYSTERGTPEPIPIIVYAFFIFVMTIGMFGHGIYRMHKDSSKHMVRLWYVVYLGAFLRKDYIVGDYAFVGTIIWMLSVIVGMPLVVMKLDRGRMGNEVKLGYGFVITQTVSFLLGRGRARRQAVGFDPLRLA
jgi:hypothetical protein